MSQLVKLKPAAGLKVRMPATPGAPAYLPEEGAAVEMNTYWYRHLQDGAVEVVPETDPSSATKGK